MRAERASGRGRKRPWGAGTELGPGAPAGPLQESPQPPQLARAPRYFLLDVPSSGYSAPFQLPNPHLHRPFLGSAGFCGSPFHSPCLGFLKRLRLSDTRPRSFPNLSIEQPCWAGAGVRLTPTSSWPFLPSQRHQPGHSRGPPRCGGLQGRLPSLGGNRAFLCPPSLSQNCLPPKTALLCSRTKTLGGWATL